MRKIAQYKVFTKIYKLALELSKSNEQILNELSHYLVDNLIAKICIYIAQENNLPFQTTTKKGRKKTYNFPRLYKEILKPLYPKIPEYDKEIQDLHNLRNLFQHGEESITLGIRSEIASEYVNMTEIILREIGIFAKDENIDPTNYLKEELNKEIFSDKNSDGSSTEVDEEAMFYKLEEIENDFNDLINEYKKLVENFAIRRKKRLVLKI